MVSRLLRHRSHRIEPPFAFEYRLMPRCCLGFPLTAWPAGPTISDSLLTRTVRAGIPGFTAVKEVPMSAVQALAPVDRPPPNPPPPADAAESGGPAVRLPQPAPPSALNDLRRRP